MLALLLAALQGATPIVADINNLTPTISSDVTSIVGVGELASPLTLFAGDLYYRAFDPKHGAELWRSGGTAASTTLVADLRPGPNSSQPQRALELGGQLLFVASGVGTGHEWHRTDGVTVTLVADIAPGITGSGIESEVVAGGAVLFVADDGALGFEVWRTDGSAAGTQVVRDVAPGGAAALEADGRELFVASNGVVYFAATDGLSGYELWRTDGTQAGTLRVADIVPGAGSSRPRGFMELGGQVYFWAWSAAQGHELWRTDGTAAGTQFVRELEPGARSSLPAEPASVVFGGQLYFSAQTIAVGTEVWRTDGTAAGTVLVADANPGLAGFEPHSFAEHAGKLYCAGTTAATGLELFQVGPSGVNLVRDVNPGPADGVLLGPVAAAGRLHFTATTPAEGSEPWISDGTPLGTTLLDDVMPGTASSSAAHFTEVTPGFVVFAATSFGEQRELWISDGTPSGTALLVDSTPGFGTPSSHPEELVSPDGVHLVFRADDGVHGDELWGYAPATGPLLLADTLPGGNGSPHAFTPVWTGNGVQTFFLAKDGINSRQLWVTDGTPAGTLQLTSFADDIFDHDGWALWPVGDRLYFYADVPNGGVELFESDGSLAGTQLVASLPGGDKVQASFEHQGQIYLALNDNVHGSELWRFDPQASALGLVADIKLGPSSGAPENFAAFGDEVWFSADDGVFGRELWRTDGTALGTSRVTDLRPGFVGSYPTNLIALGGKLFFVGQEGTGIGPEFYVHDPLVGTTTLVVDLTQNAPFTQVGVGRCQVDDALYLPIYSDFGSELYRLRANPPSLVLVEDLNPGVASGALSAHLVRAGSGFYYGGSDGIGGHEVRFYDATTNQSSKVFDAAPNGGPTELVLAGGRLYFDYEHPQLGDELGAIDAFRAHAITLLPSASPVTLTVEPPLLGSAVTLRAQGLPVPSTGILAMSPIATPSASPFVQAGQPLWVDPVAASVLTVVGTAPTWTGSYALPATPALAGVSVHVQVLALPGTALPAVTSNGVQALLGF